MHKRDSSDRPKYIFGKLGDVNQHSIGRTNIPFGGGIGFGCRPQASVLEKILLSERKKTPQYPFVCQTAVFLSALICSFGLRNAASDAVVLSSDGQKMRTAPRWCRQQCAAQDAREEEETEGNFLFSFPLSLDYFICLSICPSRLSSHSGCLDRVG